MSNKRDLHPIHPGEVLREEFLKPMGLTQSQLATAIGVSVHRISDLVSEKRRMSADLALRLSRYFGTSPQFWLGLQSDYDLDVASSSFGEAIKREIRPRVA